MLDGGLMQTGFRIRDAPSGFNDPYAKLIVFDQESAAGEFVSKRDLPGCHDCLTVFMPPKVRILNLASL